MAVTRNIPTGSVLIVLAALDTAGWDRARCCAQLGLAPGALDPGQRLPMGQAGALLDLALEVGGPGFGLRAGQRIPYGAMGLLDHLFGAAPTPRAALTDLSRYLRLVSYAVSLQLDGDTLSLALLPSLPVRHQRLLAELFFSLLVSRLAARSPAVPVCASLPGPATAAGEAPWPRTQFMASTPRLELRAGELDHPLTSADSALRSLLDGYAARELAQASAAESVAAQARQVVLDALPRGLQSAEEVARRLGLSDRSLRRALKAEGTSYRELSEACLRQVAERALADPARDIGEIAWLLGYSEPSAFHRAFRRWTGTTPGQFRALGQRGQG